MEITKLQPVIIMTDIKLNEIDKNIWKITRIYEFLEITENGVLL